MRSACRRKTEGATNERAAHVESSVTSGRRHSDTPNPTHCGRTCGAVRSRGNSPRIPTAIASTMTTRSQQALSVTKEGGVRARSSPPFGSNWHRGDVEQRPHRPRRGGGTSGRPIPLLPARRAGFRGGERLLGHDARDAGSHGSAGFDRRTGRSPLQPTPPPVVPAPPPSLRPLRSWGSRRGPGTPRQVEEGPNAT